MFFKKIFRKLSASTIPAIQQTPVAGQHNLDLRLQDIYGEQKLELQKRYEHWVVKDTWLLRDEALPLLRGVEPGSDINSGNVAESAVFEEMWQHASGCVKQGLLAVTNREQPELEWRVRPLDVYRWAKISRIPLPDILDTLMDFVARTVRIEQPPGTPAATEHQHHELSSRFDHNREMALGVAFALLAAYPDLCRDSRGRVKADKILQLMQEKGSFWISDTTMDFSSVAVRDLITRWLNTLPA